MDIRSHTIYNASKSAVKFGSNIVEPAGLVSSLDKLVGTATGSLYEIRSKRPFDFWPDRVTIFINRVTLSYKSFWATDEFPILIESITGARVYRSGISASLSIDTFGFKDNPKPITGLKQREARLARRYILALVECKKAKIDLSEYDLEELRVKLLNIGKVRKSFD